MVLLVSHQQQHELQHELSGYIDASGVENNYRIQTLRCKGRKSCRRRLHNDIKININMNHSMIH